LKSNYVTTGSITGSQVLQSYDVTNNSFNNFNSPPNILLAKHKDILQSKGNIWQIIQDKKVMFRGSTIAGASYALTAERKVIRMRKKWKYGILQNYSGNTAYTDQLYMFIFLDILLQQLIIHFLLGMDKHSLKIIHKEYRIFF